MAEGKEVLLAAAASMAMRIVRIVPAGMTHPFGDERTVSQAFPAAIPSEESDPFLMCDSFSLVSAGVEPDQDTFPVAWHPHRGMDILSYLKSGVGRHGDSMGNRETYATPGMQWISCGSGIEHAEGGGTPKGETLAGFQIWINVPSALKMADPRYGTELPEAIPQVPVAPGAFARLLAGPGGAAWGVGKVGPFATVQPVQVIDFELSPGASLEHAIPSSMNTCMIYVYEGRGTLGGQPIAAKSVALLGAGSDRARVFRLTADEPPASPEPGSGSSSSSKNLCAILFAGRKLEQPIAWHGPIVMTTRAELAETFRDLRSGAFPPKRVAWDYKRIATRPVDKEL